MNEKLYYKNDYRLLPIILKLKRTNGEPIKTKKIADDTNYSRSSIQRIISELDKLGYINRNYIGIYRGWTYSITDKGKLQTLEKIK